MTVRVDQTVQAAADAKADAILGEAQAEADAVEQEWQKLLADERAAEHRMLEAGHAVNVAASRLRDLTRGPVPDGLSDEELERLKTERAEWQAKLSSAKAELATAEGELRTIRDRGPDAKRRRSAAHRKLQSATTSAEHTRRWPAQEASRRANEAKKRRKVRGRALSDAYLGGLAAAAMRAQLLDVDLPDGWELPCPLPFDDDLRQNLERLVTGTSPLTYLDVCAELRQRSRPPGYTDVDRILAFGAAYADHLPALVAAIERHQQT